MHISTKPRPWLCAKHQWGLRELIGCEFATDTGKIKAYVYRLRCRKCGVGRREIVGQPEQESEEPNEQV